MSMAQAPTASESEQVAGSTLPTQLRLSKGMRIAVAVIVASALGITTLLAFFVTRSPQANPIRWGTTDYAVLLTNGQVFYGKIISADSEFVLLEDVFYLRQRTTSEKSELTLVKRGSEFHRPTRMYINARQVQFIEPVGPESDLAKLMAKAK